MVAGVRYTPEKTSNRIVGLVEGVGSAGLRVRGQVGGLGIRVGDLGFVERGTSPD